MEQAKLALLTVIALALCVQTWDRVVPEAHAQSSDIVCNAWRNETIGASKGDDKVLAGAMIYANEVRSWLLSHPGDTIFRTTLMQGTGYAYIDIACVRTQ